VTQRRLVLLAIWTVTAALAGSASRPAPADDKKPVEKVDVQKDIYPFLRKHCVSCHNDVTGRAKPSLTDYQDAKAIRKDGDTWRMIIKLTASGVMPPANRAKATATEITRFTRNAERLLEPPDFERPRDRSRGPTSLRSEKRRSPIGGSKFHRAQPTPQPDGPIRSFHRRY
jgi:hypothetical protein